MADPWTLAAIVLTFLLAGTVKGVVGLGLPTVSLGLLAAVLDLTTAMALLIVPTLVTNLWQALAGGGSGAVLRRVWPFLLTATAAVWLGAMALTRVDLSLLSGLLGGLLIAYSALHLAGARLVIPARWEVRAGAFFGTVNGILGGMTGSFVIPGVLFLQAIGLPRDRLVQAMGMLFLTSTAALALALEGRSLLTRELGLASAAAVIPTVAGLRAGRRLRLRLSEERFRRILFIALLALGAYLVAKAAAGPMGVSGPA